MQRKATIQQETLPEATNRDALERLQRLRRMAALMDAAVTVPGLRLRLGLDSLVGLIPGGGDLLTAIVSGLAIREAVKLKADRRTLAKMSGNILVDLAVGSIPIVGDVFDVFWKANLRNVRLLEGDLQRKASAKSPTSAKSA